MMEPKPRKRFSRREKTAYHEAGHVVMAWLLKRDIRGVSIVPSSHPIDPRVGRTTVMRRKLTPEEFFADDPAARQQFYHDNVLQYVAGDSAVALLTGRSRPIRMSDVDWNLPLGHDHVEAVSWAAKALATGNDREIRSYLLRCRREAKARLREHWPVVEALAQAALDRGTLSGDDVRQIIGQAQRGNANRG